MLGAVASQLLAPHVAVLAALVVTSGFFSGTETALFSLTRGQLQRLRSGSGAGRLVGALMRHPHRTLHTLLLGNMLVNVAYAGVSAVMVLQLQAAGAGPWATAAASLAPLVGLILVGEATPKMFAILVAERWALIVAAPVALLGKALAPLIWLTQHVMVGPLVKLLAPRPGAPREISADELGAVLELSMRRGILDRDAGDLLQEIMELGDLRVADIMVHRVDMVAYDVDAGAAGLIELFAETRLRKIPVYEGDVDHILGVVHAKRLLMNPDAPLRSLVAEVPYVPEAGSVERLLVQFRVRRRQMAIVVDEYGGTAGLVTLEDALEEIVGDIRDSHDQAPEPVVQRIDPRRYELDGDLAIHEWVDAFGIQLSSKRINTVGGFVTSLLDRIPHPGDEVTYRNLHFTVATVRGRRIDKLRLDLLEGEA